MKRYEVLFHYDHLTLHVSTDIRMQIDGTDASDAMDNIKKVFGADKSSFTPHRFVFRTCNEIPQ